jgi:hypothetical protein
MLSILRCLWLHAVASATCQGHLHSAAVAALLVGLRHHVCCGLLSVGHKLADLVHAWTAQLHAARAARHYRFGSNTVSVSAADTEPAAAGAASRVCANAVPHAMGRGEPALWVLVVFC